MKRVKSVAEMITEREAFWKELESIDNDFDAEPDADTLRTECAFFIDSEA